MYSSSSRYLKHSSCVAYYRIRTPFLLKSSNQTELMWRVWKKLFPFFFLHFCLLPFGPVLHGVGRSCFHWCSPRTVLCRSVLKPAFFLTAKRLRDHWLQKEVWLYVSLWKNDSTYNHSKQFPDKFMASIQIFKSSSDWHGISSDPITTSCPATTAQHPTTVTSGSQKQDGAVMLHLR